MVLADERGRAGFLRGVAVNDELMELVELWRQRSNEYLDNERQMDGVDRVVASRWRARHETNRNFIPDKPTKTTAKPDWIDSPVIVREPASAFHSPCILRSRRWPSRQGGAFASPFSSVVDFTLPVVRTSAVGGTTQLAVARLRALVCSVNAGRYRDVSNVALRVVFLPGKSVEAAEASHRRVAARAGDVFIAYLSFSFVRSDLVN